MLELLASKLAAAALVLLHLAAAYDTGQRSARVPTSALATLSTNHQSDGRQVRTVTLRCWLRTLLLLLLCWK